MDKVSFKTFFRVYAVAFLICVGTQTYLKLTAMNPATGFYTGNTVPIIILRITLMVVILFWFAATFLRKARHDYALNYRDLATSIFSVLTGLSIIVYTVMDATAQVTNSAIPAFRQKLTIVFTFVFGIAAGISMTIGGAQPTYGRYGKPGAILGVLPCVWQLLLLLSRFNRFIAITTLSDTIYNVLFMCFASIFLLGQSRIIYGLGIRNGRSYAFPAGMAMSVLGFMVTIPNFIYTIFGGGPMPSVHLPLSESIYIFLLSLYAPVFLIGFSKSIHKV